jgi:hypothetical protein
VTEEDRGEDPRGGVRRVFIIHIHGRMLATPGLGMERASKGQIDEAVSCQAPSLGAWTVAGRNPKQREHHRAVIRDKRTAFHALYVKCADDDDSARLGTRIPGVLTFTMK